MSISKALAICYVVLIAMVAVLRVSGIVYPVIAMGISMEPFMEWSELVVVVDREVYEQLFGANLTGKLVVFIAYGDVTYTNLQTGRSVSVHFALPTPVLHLCIEDRGGYVVAVGVNNEWWAEVVPRSSVIGVAVARIGIDAALVIAFAMGLAAAWSAYALARREEV